MHVRAIGIEYAGDANINIVHPVIVEKEGFRDPLPLVIAGTQTDAVDIAPVVLPLRMHGRVAVYLGG
jgi:hypothetical protein